MTYMVQSVPLRERLVHVRDLGREMVVREVRVKYKRSAFGLAWAMLNPLLHLLVFYFVFQVVVGLDTPRFTAYGLTGLLVYGWFTGALSQTVGSITANGNLLRQPGFPVGILPPVAVGTHMVYFLFALPVLAIFLMVGGSRPGWSLLALPVVLGIQFLLTLAVGYFVAAVNAWFRDTSHLLDVVLRLLLFVSPVFYEVSRVPEAYRDLYSLNPLVPLLEAYRAILMFGSRPDWTSLLGVGLVSAAIIFFCARFYLSTAVRTVDEI